MTLEPLGLAFHTATAVGMSAPRTWLKDGAIAIVVCDDTNRMVLVRASTEEPTTGEGVLRIDVGFRMTRDRAYAEGCDPLEPFTMRFVHEGQVWAIDKDRPLLYPTGELTPGADNGWEVL